jgi:fatty-acyl-CoA synthase
MRLPTENIVAVLPLRTDGTDADRGRIAIKKFKHDKSYSAEQGIISAAPAGTLGRLLLNAIARFGDREMISDGKTSWTYLEVGTQIGKYLALLGDLGIDRGKGIAVLSGNRAEAWPLMCAANLLGVRYTPMHPMAAEDDHAHIVADSGIAALVIDPEKFAERGRALRDRAPGFDLLSFGPCEAAIDICAASDAASPLPLVDEADAEDIAWLVYTGGTTGRSKGVMLSHRSLVTMTTIISAEWEWPADPRYAMVTPISHAGGVNLYPLVHRGGYARLLQGWDAEIFCETVERERLNCTFLVPTLINALIDAGPVRERFDLSTLQLVIYGAAPMSPDRLREATVVLGPVFLQLYGQSECPQCISTLRKVDHDLDRTDRLLSCGMPSTLIDLKLIDGDGHEAATGELGEICVRGPLVMSGYWRQKELTEGVLKEGWLHTGDVGIRDADGYLTIVDRVKDMVISGGFNIYPKEVENALMSHASVALAAVIGIPDPKWGEAVTAFVKLRSGCTVDGEELQALVKDKCGSPWAPKTVEFIAEIPLTGLGKLDRKALRAPYWEGRGRAVS